MLAGLGLMAAAAVPALGHHAFGGEFDPNKPVLLKGKITKIEWVNPHAWIHLEIPKTDGAATCEFTPNAKCESWMVEGGTPNTLLRRGITRDSLDARNRNRGRWVPDARSFADARERPERYVPRRPQAVSRLIGHGRAGRRRGSDGRPRARTGAWRQVAHGCRLREARFTTEDGGRNPAQCAFCSVHHD